MKEGNVGSGEGNNIQIISAQGDADPIYMYTCGPTFPQKASYIGRAIFINARKYKDK